MGFKITVQVSFVPEDFFFQECFELSTLKLMLHIVGYASIKNSHRWYVLLEYSIYAPTGMHAHADTRYRYDIQYHPGITYAVVPPVARHNYLIP